MEFSGPGGLDKPISLAIEGGTFNVRAATCGGTTYCIVCVALGSCSITPSPISCPAGASSQATATGTYTNGQTQNETNAASWSSSNTAVATVETAGQTNPGPVQGVGVGSTSISVCIECTYRRHCRPETTCPYYEECITVPVSVQVLGSLAINVISTPVPGETNSVVSGQSAQVQVLAKDQFGNAFTGYRGTAHFSSTDAQASLPGDYTFTASDAGVHMFTVTLKTVSGTSATRDLTVGDNGAGVSSTQNIGVWFQVTMDVERWENFGDRTCVNDGSYCYTTACDPSSGSAFASPTPFVSLPGSKSSICKLGVLVVASSGSSASTTVQDCGPPVNGTICTTNYWSTGTIPPVGGCVSDLLYQNMGNGNLGCTSNGCTNACTSGGSPNVTNPMVTWRFQ